MSKVKKHCWHPTGSSMSFGNGAPDTAEVFCCFCGRHESVKWIVKRKRVRGHGVYLSEDKSLFVTDSNSICRRGGAS